MDSNSQELILTRLALDPASPVLDRSLREPRAGDPCPRCETGKLDYDGTLNLSCPACGYSLAGCST
jgi:hypothetical protein